MNFFGGKECFKENQDLFRNSIESTKTRKRDDLVPMKYGEEAADNWGKVTRAIISPQGDDGKLFWNKTHSLRVK